MSAKNLIQITVGACARFALRKLHGAFYQVKESMGHPKRTIVVGHVEQACGSLKETKVHFEGALERFKTIVIVDDTSMEAKYKLLQQQYDFCKSKADHVSFRIEAIEQASKALFSEWEA